jgi:hypothetical protein
VSWIRIAAELIRGAMSSGESPLPPKAELPPPEDVNGLIDLMNQHRAEVNRGFDAVSQMIQAQNQRHQQALRIQRRWNYGLLAGLIAIAIVMIAAYWGLSP